MAGFSAALAPVQDPIAAPAIDLIVVMPVLIILGAACVSVVFEAVLPRKQRYVAQVSLSLLAIIAAGIWTVVAGAHSRYAVTFTGAIAVDSATYVIWGVLLVLALISVCLMADRVSEPGGAFAAQAAARIGSTRDRVATEVATPMQTEVFPLTLFAVGGMLVFPAASDLLTLFVALEVLSLPLYLMCATGPQAPADLAGGGRQVLPVGGVHLGDPALRDRADVRLRRVDPVLRDHRCCAVRWVQ